MLRHVLALYGITCSKKQSPVDCFLGQVATSDNDVGPLQDAISKQGMGFSQQHEVKANVPSSKGYIKLFFGKADVGSTKLSARTHYVHQKKKVLPPLAVA